MRVGPDLIIAVIIFVIGLLFFTIVGVIPALIIWMFGLTKAKDAWMHMIAIAMARLTCWVLHLKVNISGNTENCSKKGPYCFVVNHTSFLDALVVVGYLKLWTGFICKKELRVIPIVNLWIFALNSVYIFRTNWKASSKSLAKGAEKIKKGVPMCVFPEGTRSKTGEIAPFKRGAFRMAVKSGATVIPITIAGARNGFEWKKTNFKKVNCYLHVGDPIDFKGLNRFEQIDAEEKIEKDIKEKYKELTRRLNEAQ